MATTKRSLLAHYLNTTPAATSPTYDIMGDGITTATMNYNPQTESETYIHQDSAVTNVERYEPNFPVEQTAFPGDGVFDFVDAIRQAGPSIGVDDLTDVIEVRLYETPDTSGNVYPATKWDVQIQIDSSGGDGGAKMKVNYTLNVRGVAIPGTFDVSTFAFTAS